jgi:hypothetical protein
MASIHEDSALRFIGALVVCQLLHNKLEKKSLWPNEAEEIADFPSPHINNGQWVQAYLDYLHEIGKKQKYVCTIT